MIQSYQFGHITIGGQHYRRDLKIINRVVITPWCRKEGHYLDIDDLEDILIATPETLVVGTGAHQGMQISPDLLEVLGDRRIQLIAQPTTQAVETFNHHCSRKHDVSAAFHLFC